MTILESKWNDAPALFQSTVANFTVELTTGTLQHSRSDGFIQERAMRIAELMGTPLEGVLDALRGKAATLRG